MVKNNVDLSKLKEEINTRKSQKGEEFQDGSGGSNIGPKDKFLHGLNEALKTGRPTQSIQKIKDVDKNADVFEAKKQGKPIPQQNVNNNDNNSSQMGLADSVEVASGKAPVNKNQNNSGYEERDHLLYEEMERRKKELSSGGAMNYKQQTNEGYQYSPPQRSNEGQIISESRITEVVNDAITNKFSVVVEQAMKDQIMEIYAKSRMQETIEENRDVIKKIVIEVIRELQKNNKKS